MKRFLILLVCLPVTLAQAKETAQPVAALTPAPQVEEFELKVRFDTPVTGDHEIKTKIRVDRPYMKKMKLPEGGFIAISGLLQPSKDGTYLLLLSRMNWKSEANNTMGIGQVPLTLDKPYSWGFISSIVHSYTVTISKVKDNQTVPKAAD